MTLQEWIESGAEGSAYWFDTPSECPVGGTFRDEDGALIARVRECDIPFPCGIACCGIEYPQYVYVPAGVLL